MVVTATKAGVGMRAPHEIFALAKLALSIALRAATESSIDRDDDGAFGERGATEWMAFFRDPDGNVLALASRLRPQ